MDGGTKLEKLEISIIISKLSLVPTLVYHSFSELGVANRNFIQVPQKGESGDFLSGSPTASLPPKLTSAKVGPEVPWHKIGWSFTILNWS